MTFIEYLIKWVAMMGQNDNLITAQQLIAAICRNDKIEILSFFQEDAIFHNMPLEAAQGHEEIWSTFAVVHDICTGIDWQVHNITQDGLGKVYTERTDKYQINGKWVAFEVMGIMEFSEGKICHWRDYFDLKKSMDQMAG